jgi:hypothetical protein
LPSLEISTGPLLPPTTVSATTAWSPFTVTCFTVICCWPLPRWRSSASESRASVRAAFSECQVSGTRFKTLFRDPGPPVEVKRGGVRRDHLGAQHAFHRVLGIDTDLPSQSAERTLDGRRRHRTAGLRERARQLRRQVLVPLVMLAAAETAELSSSDCHPLYAPVCHP